MHANKMCLNNATNATPLFVQQPCLTRGTRVREKFLPGTDGGRFTGEQTMSHFLHWARRNMLRWMFIRSRRRKIEVELEKTDLIF